ncbi:TetR/AcrR family transcriptional regulator [Cellulomonas fimi]|uniref:TetR/AcrR family transcriptional regulator n=1 Tax=Cellulomonas fimi TaxID=1708 RepID=A0A7Y0LYS1_CELFI|nr:TetR/AcrR family transcriptional regulator [Cellulomonas fimi]NMR20697.1 TetR/AcrR family transcriptional regulator [Cellulomonas fimi]
MPARAAGPTKERAPLSRRRALETALAVADAEGLAAVSMRRLARELGVEAMSLYHHVASKDAILDGMVELVFGEMEHPPAGLDWKAAMLRRGASVRAVLTRHPWAIGIMQSRTAPGPQTLGHLDAVIGCSLRAGFSVEMAGHATSLIDSYVYGFVLQEVNLPSQDAGGIEGVVDAVLPDLPRDYPHLARLTVERVMRPGYSYGDEFDYGLGLLLDALLRDARAS